MQSPPAIKIVYPLASVDQNVQKSTIEMVCPNCGNDKAVWAMVQTDRADEPSIQFLQCVKCKHTWRVE